MPGREERHATRSKSETRAPVQAHQTERKEIGPVRGPCRRSRRAHREQDPAGKGRDQIAAVGREEEDRQPVKLQPLTRDETPFDTLTHAVTQDVDHAIETLPLEIFPAAPRGARVE